MKYVRVKITHLQSGEFQVITENRSEHKNLDRAIEVLSNKLHALNTDINRSEEVIYNYDFGNEYFIDEMQDLRKCR